ncbi:uncharacterized protein [Rutidosis leptorrhynchoides]|uniref:uncharacterized protein n=1 Tax=Rutidosis leptorrhynchoides TaxID=125765 RepID=UPI003A999C34
MAKIVDLEENPKNVVFNSNNLESKRKANVADTLISKYDYDFGCFRLRGTFKVRGGKCLRLNICDDVDSVRVRKRSAQMAAIKKITATPAKMESSGTTASSSTTTTT